jgi:hypothetical protein
VCDAIAANRQGELIVPPIHGTSKLSEEANNEDADEGV